MFRLGISVAVLVIAADQLSKWYILNEVMAPPRIIEVTSFFNLVLVGNRGVSFGLFSSDAAWVQPAFAVFAAGVSGFLGVWLHRAENRLLAVSLGGVIGGALGNAVDRLWHGAVIDFLDFHATGYHWPAFNIADSAITVGVVLIILEGLFVDRKESK
ncbi:MAG: signal peptidase II [Alphaproteobacteria bacterium]|nr:signal peptidase II [Alphaproteobacteria bacterium]